MSEPETEFLPKRGHVTEVCKEWLVREDGALAYKLQSQEINEFYKGNRYRNEVVRTDFPTALNEQIKEKENAQKQAESYKKFLTEQEEHDKMVALKVAEKLERDRNRQKQLELQESKELAEKLQSMYVNVKVPGTRAVYTENPAMPHDIQPSNYTHLPDVTPSYNLNLIQSYDDQQIQENMQLNRRPKKSYDSSSDALEECTFLPNRDNNMIRTKHYSQPIQPSLAVKQIIQQPNLTEPSTSALCDSAKLSIRHHNSRSEANKRPPSNLNPVSQGRPDFNLPRSARNGLDQYLENGREQIIQKVKPAHPEIEIYVDPTLREIGLPIDEIKEMNKKMKQEKKDEELARQLQEMEQLNGMSLEDRDRLLAIEAQDKELAKMLQEREKAKVKRAKEKARQRKQYQKESVGMHNGPLHPLPTENVSSSSRAIDDIDPNELEGYSNPKDLIAHQRTHTECSNGTVGLSISELEDNNKDDDIYTLPVDTCGSNRSPISNQLTDNMKNSLLVKSESSGLKRESYDSQRLTNSMTSSYDQNSSQVPPYMPSQRTRRSSSNEERKKKSKDKCTHQ